MIGFYGDVIFEVSDDKILSFQGLTRDVSSRFSEHEVIGEKPTVEYIGPGLDTISFTIILNGNHGIKPREEMDIWVGLARSGTADYLVIGDKALGTDMWYVESISEAWDVLFNKGELFSGKINVTMKEYISSI